MANRRQSACVETMDNEMVLEWRGVQRTLFFKGETAEHKLSRGTDGVGFADSLHWPSLHPDEEPSQNRSGCSAGRSAGKG